MPSSLQQTKPTTREEWMQRFTELSRPLFKQAGTPLPKIVRCSVGFPSKGLRSKTIGECWSSTSSADGVCEIFIRPSLQDDTARFADVLTHELCHAAAGHDAGHGPAFRKLATALGLVGKMTATTAGERWHDLHKPILDQIGKLPGAKLNTEVGLAGGKKKQSTRMLKLTCSACGWTCRTTAKHIHDGLICPNTDCDGDLEGEA